MIRPMAKGVVKIAPPQWNFVRRRERLRFGTVEVRSKASAKWPCIRTLTIAERSRVRAWCMCTRWNRRLLVKEEEEEESNKKEKKKKEEEIAMMYFRVVNRYRKFDSGKMSSGR
ncbi:hypothetical protein M0804_011392 [Polistes exclamans]|nr:hypothetical protein M0804_011392 [Polistes exclamans]